MTRDPNADLPILDVSPLVRRVKGQETVASEIGKACTRQGFFYAVGHGVDRHLQDRLVALARRFFAQDPERKREIRMERGGRAWRGWFAVGEELTSGKPDVKEGLYFGAELGEDDPRVRAGVPLHGPNLFPEEIPGFRETVLAYMAALTEVGHALMRGIALSLGLEPDHFRERYMRDPLTLFRIFHYPPVTAEPEDEERWGVGEHTDYGVLTILRQDDVGGLQVKTRGGWIEAPPVENAFVCNIGDMLERMTGGLYRSTAHRVKNVSGRDRYSFPFFFDPDWDARIEPVDLSNAPAALRRETRLPADAPPDDAAGRWDGASVHAFEGTYGDYVLAKVAKVFPELGRSMM